MNNFHSEIISILKKKSLDYIELNKLKNRLSKKYNLKKIPTNIEILLNCDKTDFNLLKKKLITKPARTGSGVAVIAVMTSPKKCPHVKKGIGPCIMCPGGPDSVFGDIPQSYTGKEPATMRALRNKFDPYLQIFNRLEQYIVLGQSPEKAELIIMGGTFPSYDRRYKENFIKFSFKAMNDFSELLYKHKEFNLIKFKDFFELPGDIRNKKRTKRIHIKLLKLKNNKKTTLAEEQLRNETSMIRCVALCIETRPDYGKLRQGNELLEYGCTRVELGMQTTDDKILRYINRGHSVEDSIQSTRILKDLGFKINYHVMPGLPLSNTKKDLMMMKSLFENPDFRPDMLKIYPAMVLKGTKLYDEWKKGKYKALTTEDAVEIIAEFKKNIPVYCRIQRIQRDIPTKVTEAGVDKTNLRQYVHRLMKNKGMKCRCIRCREPENNKINKKDVEILIEEYDASYGKEFFISAEDTKQDLIMGFCRMRFPSQCLRKEITKNTALIRELHVYGSAVSLGEKGEIQHTGFGRLLLEKAEQIAFKNKKNKIVIISGIGVRNYYKKYGYKKQGAYMVKMLN